MVNPAAGELSASLLQLLENGTLHSAVCNLLKPIAASLEHLLPAAIGTVTMVDIRKGLDVFYNDVSDRYPPIIPWRPPLKLDQDHKPDIWTDTFR